MCLFRLRKYTFGGITVHISMRSFHDTRHEEDPLVETHPLVLGVISMSVETHQAQPTHAFYTTPLIWVFGFALGSGITWALTTLFPLPRYGEVAIWLIMLYFVWAWVKSTRAAFMRTAPSGMPEHQDVKYSLLTSAEENRVLRYVIKPPHPGQKRPPERMVAMTKRDRLYAISRICGIIGIAASLALVSLILAVVVEGIRETYDFQSNGNVNWPFTIMSLLVLGALAIVGEADLGTRGLRVVLTLASAGLLISRSSIDAAVLVPLLIMAVGVVGSFWAWLDWKSWFFVVTDVRVYVIRLYPVGWSWLNDRKRSLLLSGINECTVDHPWWAKSILSNIGNILLNGPTDEDKEFKQLTWIPEAESVESIIKDYVGK